MRREVLQKVVSEIENNVKEVINITATLIINDIAMSLNLGDHLQESGASYVLCAIGIAFLDSVR